VLQSGWMMRQLSKITRFGGGIEIAPIAGS
jgi:hypothetical protein